MRPANAPTLDESYGDVADGRENTDAGWRSAARATLTIHRSHPDGTCQGCLEHAARLAWSPCPQRVWAETVLTAQEPTQ
jgi:hypothetical protein